MAEKIKVFYNEAMSAANPGAYSPSASKPKYVVGDWLFQPDICDHIEVTPFVPVSSVHLCMVHDYDYVINVLHGNEDNGFGNRDRDVARSLLHTTGSMWNAAQHARKHGLAVSPTSGFHHAHYDRGEGFCTFNALGLLAKHYARPYEGQKLLILDFDQHYGNGTQDILDHHDLNDAVSHITAGKSYRTGKEAMLVTEQVHKMLQTGEYGLVLYQAGADIHVDDPLGGILTTEQMRQRDANIFGACKDVGVPLVWNLAGGYQRDERGGIEPVVALHRQTMRECIKVYG